MLLKRLELMGFKSFADKTVLDFSAGTTAVVGPNGSGKSNISDAVRWVMGEMSVKSLRGSNMQDVIFAGTSTRKKVNFAEVSLVLDNSSHVFPLDYEEIVVTRRVFRSGESVYQINRANCRLKDIHELFMDTGLGRDGYSMIGQGEIGRIVSTKAEDRRSLFEEAAGVSKFKYRKEEAQRKLKGVEENLVRINDIVSELESQIGPLERQAEKARKYLVYYEEYKELDVNLSLRFLDKNKAETEEADTLYRDVEEELSGLRQRESETEARLEGLYTESREKDEEQSAEQARLVENEQKIAECSKEISICENVIENNKAMIVRIDAEIDAAGERKNQRERLIAANTEKIEENKKNAEELKAAYEKINAESEEITSEQARLRGEADKNKAEIINRINHAAELKAVLSGIETRRKGYLERREALEKEIQVFESSLHDTNAEIEENRKSAADKKEKLDKMRGRISEREERLAELEKSREENQRVYNTMRVDYDSKSSKKRILEDMENDFEGYARSVKAVLKAPQLKNLSIYGTVASLVDVDRKYVTAIENAIGGALQNIVVETEQDAKAAIKYLRDTRAGRATFLPVSSVKGRGLENMDAVSRCEGFIGAACSLVSYDPKYDGIFKSILGRVAVVDNIDNGIAMSRKFGYKFRVVTLAGDIMNAGGSMSGGSTNKNGGFLSRSAQIKTLSGELAKLSSELEECRGKDAELSDEIAGINMQLDAYRPMVRGYEDELIRIENNLKHLENTADSGDDTREGYSRELERLVSGLKSSADEIAELLAKIRDEENNRSRLEHESELLEERLEEITKRREEQAETVMDKTMQLAAAEKDIEVLSEAMRNAADENRADELAVKEKEKEKAAIIGKNAEEKAAIEEKRERIENLKTLSEEIRKKTAVIDSQKAAILEKLKNIQNANKELTDKLIQLQQELSRVDNRRVKLNLERDNTLNRLWDDYELTPAAAAEERKELTDEKAAGKRLGELKAQIKSLGHVNMEAIDEYKSVSERFEFLTGQKRDLDESRRNLTKVIESMDGLMEEHFCRQFNIINESFSQVFRELFGGGRAKLYLSEPEKVLESGVEIDVQLPGKGLQNINLYSGGEKAFIAIALLFAILNVKPTPFCILDEIDAALDDVNVSRFATYLKNYIDDTQFIVITHRRGTMEAANILYGVTMQEKGVSKLLSLNIDDVDEGGEIQE